MVELNATHLVKDEWQDRVALPAEDYLHGIISLVNELVCRDILIARDLNEHLYPSF